MEAYAVPMLFELGKDFVLLQNHKFSQAFVPVFKMIMPWRVLTGA